MYFFKWTAGDLTQKTKQNTTEEGINDYSAACSAFLTPSSTLVKNDFVLRRNLFSPLASMFQ